MLRRAVRLCRLAALAFLWTAGGDRCVAAPLDHQRLLEAQTFWDNRDWDWYLANIPFLDTPDAEINTTYYYRWELVTKHMVYGSPASGYNFTEFINRPFWSGAYGSISCPAGHQLYELRWLRDPRYARDYTRYWFDTPGAQPNRYSVWLADAAWAVHSVQPDPRFIISLLPKLVRDYEAWERRQFVPEAGLFWQTGHDDGMEYNINSRQTQDPVRGAPGYRVTLNSYLWAGAQAIARAATLAGDRETAQRFAEKAALIKTNLQAKLWDPKRNFFFEMYRQDETRDGSNIKAGTLTYQSGRFAGDPHGRELYGYVPWQFNLPDPGFESAWQYLMDRDYFFADFGPTTVERHDPMFFLADTCCYWSGQSWPYATTQTLKALANLLNNYQQKWINQDDYFRLLKVYTATQRKDGRPYIAEACYPDTGSWEHHDSYDHSEHYFHSGYTDLIITGLIGLHPRDDETIEVSPLAPASWDYFALDNVSYHGRELAIYWDKTGARYGLGAGLHLLADGAEIVSTADLGPLVATLPRISRPRQASPPPSMNFAVNNEGTHFPVVTASYSNSRYPLAKLNDGNYWYHVSPPNRWTFEGSTNATDWCAIDFGAKRRIDTVKLYLLDDGDRVAPPASFQIEYWAGNRWQPVADDQHIPSTPTGHRANVTTFAAVETDKVRAVFNHREGAATGLSEFEAWGPNVARYQPPPAPVGNLALNSTGEGYPKASASFTSDYDHVEMVNDGRIFLTGPPDNRWTAYGSPNPTDWVEIDFGAEKTVGHADLYIYDDHGGVQTPAGYELQYWTGDNWKNIEGVAKTPSAPIGGTINTAAFPAVKTSKLRVTFTHQGKSRTGLTELELWEK